MKVKEFIKKVNTVYKKTKPGLVEILFFSKDPEKNRTSYNICWGYITKVISPELDDPRDDPDEKEPYSKAFSDRLIFVSDAEFASDLYKEERPPKTAATNDMIYGWVNSSKAKEYSEFDLIIRKSFEAKHLGFPDENGDVKNGNYEIAKVKTDRGALVIEVIPQ
jgi:hypothetical protein